MPITWGNESLRVTSSPTTGDLYHWRVVLMGELFASDDTGQAIAAALEFCARFVGASADRLVDLSTVEAEESKRTIWHLGELIFESTSYRRNSSVRAALRLQHGVEDFKPGASARVCDCRACSGLVVDGVPVVFDPLCRYTAADIGPIDRDVANLNPELVAAMWDRPHYLYTLACYEREFKALASHKESAGNASDHGHGQDEETIRAKQVARMQKHKRR